MLIEPKIWQRSAPRTRQSGVVLVIALIVLVAMTLAGIALVRSVDTTNVIAGNLAFRQAATHAGDKGIEAAIACLRNDIPDLTEDGTAATDACGYTASRVDPSSWPDTLDGQGVSKNINNNGAGGNNVTYVIHRLCTSTGNPSSAASGCSFAPLVCRKTNLDTTSQCLEFDPPQVNYRITVRIAGPRNTVSYIQSIVAL